MRMTALAMAVALTGGAAQAQDTYMGVALDYGTPHAGEDQALASVMAGASFDLGGFALGAEVEYGASVAFAGDYNTTRLRLVGGYDLNGFTALATLGTTRYDFGDTTNSGYNYGIGGQFAISESLDVRGEIMRDMMGTEASNTTTTRVAAIYSF